MVDKNKVKKIIEQAAKDLDNLGVKYFLGVCKQMPTDPSGGYVYADENAQGTDIQYMLGVAFPMKSDKINLGVWVGNLLKADITPAVRTTSKSKLKKAQTSRRANKKATDIN